MEGAQKIEGMLDQKNYAGLKLCLQKSLRLFKSNVSSIPIKNFNDVSVFHLIYNDYKL